jgi:hypothetical protein
MLRSRRSLQWTTKATERVRGTVDAMRRLAFLLVPALAACPDRTPADAPDSASGGASGGVDVDQPAMIRDQSGAQFEWLCDADGHCTVGWIDGLSPALPECDAGRIPTYGYLWLRFFEVTAACALDQDGALGTEAGWGRFVVCGNTSECPQLPEYGDLFECRSGYCQRTNAPSGPPRKEDLELLCTGSAPRFAELDPSPELAAAIDQACPTSAQDPESPCIAIPPGCDDPG